MSIPDYLSSLFSLSGKIALVTGGTRGIGASMAKALAQAGADIVLVQRITTATTTQEYILSLGRRAWVVQCDLASAADVSALVPKVLALTPDMHIDILVNCAGIQRRMPAENFPDNYWDEVLQVNLHTVFTLCRNVGQQMLERTRDSNAKIINVASLVSYQGGVTVPAYAAAKHGVLGITKALSNEWSGRGINVNAIAPGYIATDMNVALIDDPTRSRQIMERIPAGRWGAPDDFEGAVIFLASRASDYVCGESLVVDGGWMGR